MKIQMKHSLSTIVVTIIIVVYFGGMLLHNNQKEYQAKQADAEIHAEHTTIVHSMTQDGVSVLTLVGVTGIISDEREIDFHQLVRNVFATVEYKQRAHADAIIEQRITEKRIPVTKVSTWIENMTFTCDRTGCTSGPTELMGGVEDE